MKRIFFLPFSYLFFLAALNLPKELLSQPTGTDTIILVKPDNRGTIKTSDNKGYENMVTFTGVGSSSWVIPAGVSKLFVEAWGGGGGATGLGGGGGGGYINAIFNVSPGGALNYTIGGGGAGNATTATNGGATSISFSSTTIVTSYGGSGNVTTTYAAALGGGFSGLGAGYYGIPGEAGGSNNFESFALNAATYRESQTGGKGGDAGNSPNSGGKGSYQLREAVVNGAVLYTLYGSDGKMPGGGAGGNLTWGGRVRNGGQGMIIVRY